MNEIDSSNKDSSFRNDFASATDLLHHFFNELNNWLSKYINIQFMKYYEVNYPQLIEKDLAKLNEKDLEVFRYQKLIDKTIKDRRIKGASYELFSHVLSMSNYTKQTLKVLHIEMDAVKEVGAGNQGGLDAIKARVNNLIMRYNKDYDVYFKDLTPIRLEFMEAIETFLRGVESGREN